VATIEEGARLFAYDSRGWTLKPQQYEVGAALDRRQLTTAVCMSRRSAKTESVLLWTFAMMDAHPGLKVAFTMATTREAARAKFLEDVLPVLEELQVARPDLELLRGGGYEQARLNGSLFRILAPSDKAFRSKAFDIVIVDEGQAGTGDGVQELLAGMLATLDTSWLGMLVVMGTAGDVRAGSLLYDALHDPEASTVDYSAEDGAVDVARLEDWDYASAMLEQYHPGIRSGMTTLARIKRNWTLLTPERFARDYLSVWGNLGGAGGMFSLDTIAALELEGDFPDPPRYFALGVSATDERASIVAAWRERGEGRMLLLENRPGRAWLPLRARELARKYRVKVTLDPKESTVMQDVKQSLEQLRPAPALDVQDYEDVAAAHERMKRELEAGTVRHWGQDELVSALTSVTKQRMGAKWKYAAVTPEADITAARAATLALRAYDAQRRRPEALDGDGTRAVAV
jgi:hypothetical protein